MSTTARDLITNALRDLAAIGANQPVSAGDLDLGLTLLNEWVGSIRTQRTATFMASRNVFPLTANVSTYTIGTGGAFNVDRPTRIEGVGVVLDRTQSLPIELNLGRPMSVQEYRAVVAKGLTSSYPSAIWYDYGVNTSGLGTITLYPTPTGGNVDLVLYLANPLGRFADLSTTYYFPDGYERAIRANLAIEMAPAFEREPSGALIKRAAEAMADIRRANRRPSILRTGYGVGAYNIWSDE